MSCLTQKPSSSRTEVHGLKLQIRDLKNELFDIKMRTNSCGEIDDCSVQITGAAGGGGTTAVTWSSFAGLTYKVESSPDYETWTTIIEAFPSGGDSTTFSLSTPASSTYYRVTENPLFINLC